MTTTYNGSVNIEGVQNLSLPVFKFDKPKGDIDKVIQCFLIGNTGKFGKYYAVKNALVYRTIITNKYGKEVKVEQNIVALRIDRNEGVLFIGNSSTLPLIGRSVAFGNEKLNQGETEIQRRLSLLIQMIPFTVFTQANLNLNNLNIIDRGVEEILIRKIQNPKYDKYNKEKMSEKEVLEFIDESVHFTGSSLFEVDGNTFLFDIDRIEIEHKIFNPFLVKLANKVTSINEAYQCLKPNEVVDAEKLNVEVKRQGEWFFIPTKRDFTYEMGSVVGSEKTTLNELHGIWRIEHFELKAGKNRPNRAQQGLSIQPLTSEGQVEHYVKGWIVHSGREHQPLFLKEWHKCIPNTSIESFTITGNID